MVKRNPHPRRRLHRLPSAVPGPARPARRTESAAVVGILDGVTDPDRPWFARIHPAVLYTVGRLAIFGVLVAIFALLNFRHWALVILPLVLSVPISAIALRRLRHSWASRVDSSLTRRRSDKAHLRAQLRGDISPE